ncbi:hypothetical protein C7271_19345 [filamentous cyanobacterium CCP5]|nr:hypothetical protein C7271_19345 [filamentous cyanobacterium CCP5]
MSKRRNPKKEKALRNQAYARRFRKKRTGGQRFFKRNGRNGSDGDSDSSDDRDGAASSSSSN